jgi:hypothetical protein
LRLSKKSCEKALAGVMVVSLVVTFSPSFGDTSLQDKKKKVVTITGMIYFMNDC